MKKKRLLPLGILAVLVLAALIHRRTGPQRGKLRMAARRGAHGNADFTSLTTEIPPLAPKPPAVGDDERYAAE